MSLLYRGLRRLFVGSKVELTESAADYLHEQMEPDPTLLLLQDLEERAAGDRFRVVVGAIEEATDYSVSIPVHEMYAVHRWCIGGTGSGKSAQLLAEEIQLIGPGMPWSVVHVDAKGESARWITDLLLPALLADADDEIITEMLEGLNVVSPFDERNLPEMNLLLPVPGMSRSLQAKEIANLISEALGPMGSDWGIRMMGILLNGLRLALSVGGLSLMELRSALINERYLNGLLAQVEDYDVKEYFVYRFPHEPTESIQAVIARLDMLLFEDTARVLCAPRCLSYSYLLEGPLTVINLGGAPRGAEFLTRFWISVFVRGLARAIHSRKDTRRPVFAALDEWWLGLDADLAGDFESLLTLARHKNVALWLINQLPAQVASRSASLLATIENSCGFQTIFRQSPSDARRFNHIYPVSEHFRKKKTPDSPKYDTRIARDEEQRKHYGEELIRLPNRHFWFYPRALGRPGVKLIAPDVPFEEMVRAARRASPELRALCRGHGGGSSAKELDDVVAQRRHQIREIAGGHARDPRRDFRDRVAHEVQGIQRQLPAPAEPKGPVKKTPSATKKRQSVSEHRSPEAGVERQTKKSEVAPGTAPATPAAKTGSESAGGQQAPPPAPEGKGERATKERKDKGGGPKKPGTSGTSTKGPFLG